MVALRLAYARPAPTLPIRSGSPGMFGKAEALEEIRRAAGGARGTVRSFFGSVRARDVLEARQNLSLLDPDRYG